jgi:transglycosylase-like protein with SLT domain
MTAAVALFDAARSYKRELTRDPLAKLVQEEVDAINAVTRDKWSKEVVGMAWGAKVSQVFRERVLWICDELGLQPNDLMACIAWESGRSFSPSVRNMAGSGATGLIQFMPGTAKALGTTVDHLARLTAEDQLNYVYKYFAPYSGRLKSLSDVYMAILWPKAVGKSDDYVLFQGPGIAYRQNAGLDLNRDMKVTKAECSAKLYAMRAEGLRPDNIG